MAGKKKQPQRRDLASIRRANRKVGPRARPRALRAELTAHWWEARTSARDPLATGCRRAMIFKQRDASRAG
eukprot:5847583-Pyramimonas_sp.AAC.1